MAEIRERIMDDVYKLIVLAKYYRVSMDYLVGLSNEC